MSFIFFFKQKTAYEMRISDWSSDVCSSDLSRDEIAEVAREYWDAGVRHIVALRGDPPVQGEKFAAHPEGYANAAELTEGLLKVAPFEISVAAYPECHPEALSPDSDVQFLKRKFDAGATRGIRQFFFEADTLDRKSPRLNSSH